MTEKLDTTKSTNSRKATCRELLVPSVDISKIDTINVGIVGHIDHGKTTLLQRLSGKWADTHSEELKRGITIKLGYADAIIYEEAPINPNSPQQTAIRGRAERQGSAERRGELTTNKNSKGKPIRYITFVDAPGHEMLMATMLSGAAIMDAAILVVAANEGIKPQTQEHLVALKAKKINKIIIVQNKIDLVSKENALKNYKDIKKFIEGTIAEDAPIIPISAQQKVNLDKILEELCKIEIIKPTLKEKPLFLVARSFDINLPGTKIKDLHGGVIGGALKQGVLKVGDIIEIKPGYSYQKQGQYHYKTVQSKIISMQKGEYPVTEAIPGGSLAIETELDPSLTKADALSGSVASLRGNLPEITEKITIKFTLFKEVFGTGKHEPVQNLKTPETLMLSLNTSTTVGQLIKINKNEAELTLKIPIVPLKGESIGIARNFNNHWRLIGFGEII